MRKLLQAGAAALAFMTLPAMALAAGEPTPSCGPGKGKAAMGKPIKVGAIHGNAAPG